MPKQVEGDRYQKMIDHCKGDALIPFTTMRNGPVDFAFLRKQMKSFPGKDWPDIMIRVGNLY